MRQNFSPMVVMTCSAIAAMPTLSSAQAHDWRTPAKWHRTLKKAQPGTLLLDPDGVEFRTASGGEKKEFSHRWRYVDIHTFDLSQHELTLFTYENRQWHEPGERPFRFTLGQPMPPEVAAQFTDRVGKPVRNGAPTTTVTTIQEIPAHRRVWSGASNGLLRLKEDGIDYVTENKRDSRSWRWADIQTLANPNPYEFRVTAFREIVEFDLKQPLARDVFEKLWDHLDAGGLNNFGSHGASPQEIHQ